jgi:hypothetical protein
VVGINKMLTDPYNYPSLNRTDLMSLSSISKQDTNQTTTKRFTSNRLFSMNLETRDIDGKQPKIIV